MRIALAVFFTTVLLAGAVVYRSSIATGAQAPVTDAKPPDSTKPADTKPADTKPADTKPAEARPADAKEKKDPAASGSAGENVGKAATPAAGAKNDGGGAAKAAEPPKTVPTASGAGSSPAASTAKPAAVTPVAAKPAIKMPPPKGSHLKDDDNMCVQCHTTAEAWDPKDPVQYRFYMPLDGLKKDVHFQKGVNCVDCHGGDPTIMEPKAHQAKDDFRRKLPEIEKFCAYCHEKDVAILRASPHKDASCLECHARTDAQGTIVPHSISASMKEKLADQVGFCGKCHSDDGVKAGRAKKDVITDLRKSVHARAGEKNAQGEGTPLGCAECHGKFSHGLLPVTDPKSPVRLIGQVQACGGCHKTIEKDRDKVESFLRSVHGQALEKKGLTVGPGCADCHGSHNVFRARDRRSTLHESNVADTCGKCHQGIEDRLRASVHGRGGLGGEADRPAPGGTKRQKPICTDCHQGHELQSPESVAFREAEPDRCGNCHAAMSSSYNLSMHGKLTTLGYGPAAKCADCHGSHDILPPDDPNSTLSPENRVHTCTKCHINARANFSNFSPHIDASDARKNPVVHAIQVALFTLLYSTFAFFGIHSLLWFIRGMVEVLKHGRPHGLRPGQTAYVRFVSFHRIGHTIMMSSFLGLALTGLPLRYCHAPWAQSLARYMGGFESTGFWHRFFGIILLTSMLVYLARMVRLLVEGRKQGRPLVGLIFGSDSPIPTLRDLKDFLKMLRWFFGLGPRPGFDRWSYWEKIDFWGAIADTVIIGSTGLVLWFPNFFCGPLPGTTLDIAKVIHSTQALLATGFVFAIHFFNTHFRPDRFPADMSVLSGLVSEEEFKEDRPEYFERLEREGKLEALRTTSPGVFVLWCIRSFGFVALAIGLALLVGMIVAAMG